MVEVIQCRTCVHLLGYVRRVEDIVCDAFPDGIPEAIAGGDFDHRQPYPGDHGIRWEPQPTREAGRATD